MNYKITWILVLGFFIVFTINSCKYSGLNVRGDFFWKRSVYKELFVELSRIDSQTEYGFLYYSDLNDNIKDLISKTDIKNIDLISYVSYCDNSIIIEFDGNWRLGYFPCKPAKSKLIYKYEPINFYSLNKEFALWQVFINIY